jgi:hypothetical protein
MRFPAIDTVAVALTVWWISIGISAVHAWDIQVALDTQN